MGDLGTGEAFLDRARVEEILLHERAEGAAELVLAGWDESGVREDGERLGHGVLSIAQLGATAVCG